LKIAAWAHAKSHEFGQGCRRAIWVALLAALTLAPQAFAQAESSADDRAPTYDDFLRSIADNMDETNIPVLLPSRLPDLRRTAFVDAEVTAQGYRITIQSDPECNHVNACFLGLLSGEKGARLALPQKLQLADGTAARFQPPACGGSCSLPTIEWKMGEVVYTIQLALSPVDEKQARAVLAALASDAIKAGPRH
jgi:hypothetical protein